MLIAMTPSAQIQAFSNELQKIAARRGMKIIGSLFADARKAFAAGDNTTGEALMSKAQQLSKTPGVVKPSAAGSQMRGGFLGRGSEGAVTAVADPEFGIAARKLYDPQGIATPELIRRKDEVGKAMRGNSSVAEYFGQRPTPSGGGAMQFSEFVPQGPAPGVNPRTGKTISHTQAIQESSDYGMAKSHIRKSHASTGFSDPQDIRAANMVRDPRTGSLRAVDVIPAKPGEFASRQQRAALSIPENSVAATSEAGEKLLNFSNIPNKTDTQTLKGSLLGRRGISSLNQPSLSTASSTMRARPIAAPRPKPLMNSRPFIPSPSLPSAVVKRKAVMPSSMMPTVR